MYESLTDSPMNKKLCFCLCMALLAAFVMPEKLRAQRPDFTTWLNVGAEYELKKSGFTLESGLEWRTKDHFRQTDRVGWNVDGSYQLLPWLKVGMGYELHLRNLDEEEWGFRHRYKLQATLSARVWSRLKVSLREKFQHTLDGDEENELRLRTRLKLAYDVPRSGLEPYVSVEMYNGLARGEHFDVPRMRYRGGLEFPVIGRWEGELFYIYQDELDKSKHVLGVGCVYKF